MSLHVTMLMQQVTLIMVNVAGTCYDGECEGLHLPQEERKQHSNWETTNTGSQKLIITAGMLLYASCIAC